MRLKEIIQRVVFTGKEDKVQKKFKMVCLDLI